MKPLISPNLGCKSVHVDFLRTGRFHAAILMCGSGKPTKQPARILAFQVGPSSAVLFSPFTKGVNMLEFLQDLGSSNRSESWCSPLMACVGLIPCSPSWQCLHETTQPRRKSQARRGERVVPGVNWAVVPSYPFSGEGSLLK